MGNFYTNITVTTGDLDGVVATLTNARRRAYAVAAADAVVVYDERADEQLTDELEALAAQLSRAHACVAFAVLDHDDDVLWYVLYRGGERLDGYDSGPGFGEEETAAEPEGGDAAVLCAAFGAGRRAEAVEAALRDGDCVFAVDRHEQLADALGLPAASVGSGYNYIARGEIPEGVEAAAIRRVGGAPAPGSAA